MTCPSGKVPYPSPQAAYSTASHLTRKGARGNRRRRKHAHAYKCACGSWHLTSIPDRR